MNARHGLLVATTAVLASCLVVGVALAQHATPTPTARAKSPFQAPPPLYGQLANGDPVMVYMNQLFYVGQRGVRSLCPDGVYDLKNGTRLPILAAHIVPPWVKQGFNPQPEPPGKELFALTENGQKLALSQGLLFFEGVGGGPRARCGDGTYALRGGASLRILGGQLQNPTQLQGFAP
ncbi:MAG TPA: hypothetical protein VMT19_12130 [Thermoanaerobaculaceae bacterium]|nr:hypothetical protein [Thermoanaerobaculaceae bacterium]